MLQALLLQVYPSDEALHDILVDIRMLLIQAIEVEALLIQDIRIKLTRRVIERGLPLLLQLRHPVGDHRLQVLAVADDLTHLILPEIAQADIGEAFAYDRLCLLLGEVIIEGGELHPLDQDRQGEPL